MTSAWRRGRLADFASEVSTGPFGSLLHKSDYVDNGIPLVNPINIEGETIVPNPSKLVDQQSASRLASYVLRCGDIVVARRGDIGRCAVIGQREEGWICGTGCFFVRPLPSVHPHFLARLLRSNREKLEAASSGATMLNLSNTALSEFDVSLPPLAEQQRIVGILDEAFAGIAAAKANAEQNRRKARAVFEGYLQAAFAQRDDGLEERRLDQLYQIGSSKRVLKSQWTGAGVPFYRGREITALATEGRVDNELFISEEHYSELSKQTGVPKAEDIMITAIGTIGNAYIVREDDRFYFKDASVLWMRRNTDVNSEFVKYWLGSSFFFDQLDRGNGATVDTLTIQKLQSVIMPLPTVAEQRRIVSELSKLRAETQHLESLYARKLAALDELKQSLLHQAFSGAL